VLSADVAALHNNNNTTTTTSGPEGVASGAPRQGEKVESNVEGQRNKRRARRLFATARAPPRSENLNRNSFDFRPPTFDLDSRLPPNEAAARSLEARRCH
jgi:hypothetical protein